MGHIKKNIHTIKFADLRRIHWKKYLTRKVFILALFGAAGYTLEHYWHIWFAGKGGELAFGTVVEHLLFEVPVEES
jgi:hypothetical protein